MRQTSNSWQEECQCLSHMLTPLTYTTLRGKYSQDKPSGHQSWQSVCLKNKKCPYWLWVPKGIMLVVFALVQSPIYCGSLDNVWLYGCRKSQKRQTVAVAIEIRTQSTTCTGTSSQCNRSRVILVNRIITYHLPRGISWCLSQLLDEINVKHFQCKTAHEYEVTPHQYQWCENLRRHGNIADLSDTRMPETATSLWIQTATQGNRVLIPIPPLQN